MRTVSLAILSASIGLSLVACRGSSNNNGVDASPDADTSYKIQDVQSETMAPGTPVSLSGVIVTAADTYGARTGDLWVEEPEGGPLSGIHVFKADPTVVATLQPGDIVNVSNSVKTAFTYMTDTSGRSEIELEPPMSGSMVTVTKTGTGTVPAPAAVDALMIGKLADPDRSAQWKMWDGVLITLTNVSETSTVKQVSGSMPDPTLKSFKITGVALVESDLSAFPSSGLGFNACLSSVTGVVNYFFDYEILNRADTDISVAGSAAGCPPPEGSTALCGDGIDNDGNGFSDCSDNNCIAGVTTCRAPVTIAAIDAAADANPTMPTLPAGAPVGVGITGAIITAVSSNGSTFWVANNKAAAANGGVEVFAGSQQLVTAADVGHSVDLAGTLSAFNNDSQGESLPEVNVLAVSNKSTSAQTATASTQTVATLTTAATGRPFVGSLVTISNVTVVTAADPANHNIAQLKGGSGGGTAFYTEADIHVLAAAAGATCYNSITGIWSYDVFNNRYALEVTAEPTGTTGTCN